MGKIRLLSCVLSVFLLGCETEGETDGDHYEYRFFHSYIMEYVEGRWSLDGHHPPRDNDLNLGWDHETYGALTSYLSPDITGKESAKFTEIAHRNGDISYNQSELWPIHALRACPAENFSRLIVKGFGADWDNEHPKGSGISDLVTVKIYSCADFIRNGYTGEEFRWIEKKAALLTEADLTLFSGGLHLHFEVLPPMEKPYVIEATLVTTDGKEYKAYYRNDPEMKADI